jgi:hypothetical protein
LVRGQYRAPPLAPIQPRRDAAAAAGRNPRSIAHAEVPPLLPRVINARTLLAIVYGSYRCINFNQSSDFCLKITKIYQFSSGIFLGANWFNFTGKLKFTSKVIINGSLAIEVAHLV